MTLRESTSGSRISHAILLRFTISISWGKISVSISFILRILVFVCVFNYLRVYYHVEYQDDDVHVVFVNLNGYSRKPLACYRLPDILCRSRINEDALAYCLYSPTGLSPCPPGGSTKSPNRNKIRSINVDKCMNVLV